MRAAELPKLEGQLTAGAAESVARRVAAHLGVARSEVVVLGALEQQSAAERLAMVEKALGSGTQSQSPAAIVAQWQRQDAGPEAARRDVVGWLGGSPVAAGLWDKDAAPLVALLEQAATHPHRLVLDHGTLRSWQVVRVLDALAAVAAEPLPALVAARRAVQEHATVLGHVGPPVYRTLVVARRPLPSLDDLNPYVLDADEKIMAVVPAVVTALQSMYLMGYVQQRDLDVLRSQRARLEQELEQISEQQPT